MSDHTNNLPPAVPGESGEISEAEESLKAWNVKYEKQPDGTLVVPGNLDIGGKGLSRLPDLSAVVIKGNFLCRYNNIATLEGAPQSVGGNYSVCLSNEP
jgi:hypothetical protein